MGLFYLHYVHIPNISHPLNVFDTAFNNHSLQIFKLDRNLFLLNHPEPVTEERIVDSALALHAPDSFFHFTNRACGNWLLPLFQRMEAIESSIKE